MYEQKKTSHKVLVCLEFNNIIDWVLVCLEFNNIIDWFMM